MTSVRLPFYVEAVNGTDSLKKHDPKLCNMVHALSLNVFIAFKGTCAYIFIQKCILFQTKCLQRCH